MSDSNIYLYTHTSIKGGFHNVCMSQTSGLKTVAGSPVRCTVCVPSCVWRGEHVYSPCLGGGKLKEHTSSYWHRLPLSFQEVMKRYLNFRDLLTHLGTSGLVCYVGSISLITVYVWMETNLGTVFSRHNLTSPVVLRKPCLCAELVIHVARLEKEQKWIFAELRCRSDVTLFLFKRLGWVVTGAKRSLSRVGWRAKISKVWSPLQAVGRGGLSCRRCDFIWCSSAMEPHPAC